MLAGNSRQKLIVVQKRTDNRAALRDSLVPVREHGRLPERVNVLQLLRREHLSRALVFLDLVWNFQFFLLEIVIRV